MVRIIADFVRGGGEMVSPYYEDDWVTIYCGDAREVLPELGTVGLIITDPPYGMRWRNNKRSTDMHSRLVREDFKEMHGDDVYPTWLFEHKPRVAMLVFCRWQELCDDLPRPDNVIVWNKVRHTMGDLKDYAPCYELIAVYKGWDHELCGKRPLSLITNLPAGARYFGSKASPSTSVKHPAQKPVSLMSKLIMPYAPDLTVVDPFMGSGTTLAAARLLGRRSVGIEIEERYCEVAVDRLRQGVMRFPSS